MNEFDGASVSRPREGLPAGIDGPKRVVERHIRRVVVEPGPGIAEAQEQRIPRELCGGVEILRRVLNGRRHFHEAAVAEAAAVRQVAVAIDVPEQPLDRQLRRREVLEAALEDVPARLGVECARILVGNTAAIEARGCAWTCA